MSNQKENEQKEFIKYNDEKIKLNLIIQCFEKFKDENIIPNCFSNDMNNTNKQIDLDYINKKHKDIGYVFDFMAKPNGCVECKNGFKGRLAIFEFLLINDFVSKQIVQDKTLTQHDKNFFWSFSKHSQELFMQNKIYFNDLVLEF